MSTEGTRDAVATVSVAAGVWCRWAPQVQALALATGRRLHPPPGAPAWRVAEFVAGRRLLATLLDDVLPGRRQHDVVSGANGRPVLEGIDGVGISISHSDPLVAVALAVGCEVGVDVELPLAGRADDVCWEWTVHEACLKATGAGLSGGRRPVGRADRAAGTWREVRWRALREESAVPLAVAWRPCPVIQSGRPGGLGIEGES